MAHSEGENSTLCIDGMTAVVRAANFAAIKHKDQKRKDDVTPYINHPLGVANLICEIGKVCDPVIIQAAILHDTVEDTDTTLDEVREHFGAKVAHVVGEVTDDMSLPKRERKALQLQHAPTLSYEARMVKLADKLYNLRDCTPSTWTADYRAYYIKWCRDVVNCIRGTNVHLEKALDDFFAEHNHIFST